LVDAATDAFSSGAADTCNYDSSDSSLSDLAVAYGTSCSDFNSDYGTCSGDSSASECDTEMS